MHVYTSGQWVLLFFFYCFCGWVWECCYVSARQRHWVNRGFLHGPLLPIYGTGAVIILLVTIPVEDDLRLVYLFGMVAATVLEYVTGAVMERLFRVRYWDYSNQKWNLNGYICLSSSIAWGFFSILMVRFIHPPIARLLLRVPAWCVDPLALALTASFTVDVVRSVQATLDLREILTKLAEVEKRLLQQRIDMELKEQRQARAERKAQVEAMVQRRTAAKLDVLETVAEALITCRKHLDSLPNMTPEKLEIRRVELDEIIRHVQERQAVIRSRPANAYHRSLRILRANPSATAKEFQEVWETLRNLVEQK